MDLRTVYRDELPYEQDVLESELFALEALGHLARDLIGPGPAAGGFACVPTAPASLAVKVGPGRLYKAGALLATDWGKKDGTGGLAADTDADHFILKQALSRATATFNTPAPAGGGTSIKYLIEAEFVEVDDAPTTKQFYNTANPTVPITADVSPRRRCVANLYLIAGAAGAPGAIPGTTAGRVPLWVITVANGQASVTAPNIVAAPGAPFVTVGGGGGGGGSGTLAPWVVISANGTTVTTGTRVILDASGGARSFTLPAAPAAGDEVWVKCSGLTNNGTILRNGKTINGSATDYVIDKNNVTLILAYDGATWTV